MKGESYFEMRTLSPFLNVGFLYSRSGLPYRTDKFSKILVFFGTNSIEHFFSGIRCCDDLRHFVKQLVSKIFHVTIQNIRLALFCAFTKCSVIVTQCSVSFYSFSLEKFFKSSSNICSPVDPSFFGSIF